MFFFVFVIILIIGDDCIKCGILGLNVICLVILSLGFLFIKCMLIWGWVVGFVRFFVKFIVCFIFFVCGLIGFKCILGSLIFNLILFLVWVGSIFVLILGKLIFGSGSFVWILVGLNRCIFVVFIIIVGFILEEGLVEVFLIEDWCSLLILGCLNIVRFVNCLFIEMIVFICLFVGFLVVSGKFLLFNCKLFLVGLILVMDLICRGFFFVVVFFVFI